MRKLTYDPTLAKACHVYKQGQYDINMGNFQNRLAAVYSGSYRDLLPTTALILLGNVTK